MSFAGCHTAVLWLGVRLAATGVLLQGWHQRGAVAATADRSACVCAAVFRVGAAFWEPESTDAAAPPAQRRRLLLAAEVLVIAVHPDLQGQGLGRALLAALEGALAGAGVHLALVRLSRASSASAPTRVGAGWEAAAPEQDVEISDESDSEAAAAAPAQAPMEVKPGGLWQGYSRTGGALAAAAASMQGLLHQQGACLHHKQLEQ